MTKQQYIDYWINNSAEDWLTVEAMFSTGRYLHSLFWAHLSLEKLAKGHWIKVHNEDIPPKVHNIIWLLEESKIDLGTEMMAFLVEFNRFQLSARYPDYLGRINKICTKEFTFEQLNKVKDIKQCLLEKLQ
ncbi:MAG: HEPN domain-containing protein [Prevotellaceae bacterium]|jgi:HEPN domain-containing protein|nr:HEPN domain-containing protein [Prevotellaceae bacterium]